jgi:hypothetical protein
MTNTEKVRRWRAANPERNREINRDAQRRFRRSSMKSFGRTVGAIEIEPETE